jgi:hypothetical protein
MGTVHTYVSLHPRSTSGHLKFLVHAQMACGCLQMDLCVAMKVGVAVLLDSFKVLRWNFCVLQYEVESGICWLMNLLLLRGSSLDNVCGYFPSIICNVGMTTCMLPTCEDCMWHLLNCDLN